MFAILVVDDDAPMRRLIALHLARAGYRPIEACDAREALDALDREHVDLMVVDVMMPGTDGCALTRCLRDAGYDLPVLMVTAKERIDDKRAGFAAGADDYLVKPVDFEEMLMRVAALLRRAKIDAEQRIEMGDVVLDHRSFEARTPDGACELPPKEFLLLFKLLSHPGRIFTRRELMDEIWGLDSESTERTVDVHVNRLRARFAACAAFSIETVRGVGYKAVRGREGPPVG